MYYLRLLLGPFFFVLSISFSIFSQMIVNMLSQFKIHCVSEPVKSLCFCYRLATPRDMDAQ